MTSFSIDGRVVGPDEPPFVIAELSGNHNGDLERAMAIVRSSAIAGVDAIKLQTYTADTMTLDVDAPAFRLSQGHELWGSRRLYDLYDEAHTPWEWHRELFEEARRCGILGFSSPFDATAVEFLETLGVPAYKIASAEIVDLPLIRTAASTGKPIIISTGMATLEEATRAVEAARSTGNDQIALLKCSASYPAPAAESNLRAIPMMRESLGVEVGYSDHTMGIGVPVAAVALGATIIEKHVTLDRAGGGVDSAFSSEPEELARLVTEVRAAHASLGGTGLGPTPSEAEVLRFRRSLYVAQDTRAGDLVTTDNVRAVRPAGGLEPDALTEALGARFVRDVTAGTPLGWDLLDRS